MAITPAGANTTVTPQTTTANTTAAQPLPPPNGAPVANAPPPPANTFTNGQQVNVTVAGVAADVPPAPPPPLTGTAYKDGYASGTIYDATAFLADRLKLTEGGELRLFHHAYQQWPDSKPGERAWMSTKHSGGVYGKGFYTSTRPETGYGKNEFQVAIPVKAFAGKQILESTGGGFSTAKMPEGVDILAVRQGKEVWFVFKPGSDQWLNASATTADWDAPGEQVGWS